MERAIKEDTDTDPGAEDVEDADDMMRPASVLVPEVVTDVVLSDTGVARGYDESSIQALVIDRYVYHLTDEEVCAKHAISRPTMYRRLRSPIGLEIRTRIIPQAAKREITLLWADKVQSALSEMTPDKLKDSSALELAKVAGIGTDKLQILTGGATEIVETRSVNAVKLLRFLRDST